MRLIIIRIPEFHPQIIDGIVKMIRGVVQAAFRINLSEYCQNLTKRGNSQRDFIAPLSLTVDLATALEFLIGHLMRPRH
jgi:hypothetical protein